MKPEDVRRPTGKRGRPRKTARREVVYPTIAFVQLPDGPIRNVPELAKWMRDYVRDRPHINDSSGDLAKWLAAAADALEADNSAHLAWYCFNALRMQYIVAMQELLDVPANATDARVGVLARVGVDKLKSDKRRGHRGDW